MITNKMVEDLEQRTLTIFPNPLSILVRYLDDGYTIMETVRIESSHQYLYTINSSIQFIKEIKASGSLAFLDVFLRREADGSVLLMFTGSPRIPVAISLCVSPFCRSKAQHCQNPLLKSR